MVSVLLLPLLLLSVEGAGGVDKAGAFGGVALGGGVSVDDIGIVSDAVSIAAAAVALGVGIGGGGVVDSAGIAVAVAVGVVVSVDVVETRGQRSASEVGLCAVEVEDAC